MPGDAIKGGVGGACRSWGAQGGCELRVAWGWGELQAWKISGDELGLRLTEGYNLSPLTRGRLSCETRPPNRGLTCRALNH